MEVINVEITAKMMCEMRELLMTEVTEAFSAIKGKQIIIWTILLDYSKLICSMVRKSLIKQCFKIIPIAITI